MLPTLKRLIILALLISGIRGAPLIPETSEVRIKNVTLNGNLGLTLAEFSMRFNEPLYFQFPAPCPAGRCPIERQQAYLDANPCEYMACDFTLKGSDCGKARLPECEPLCASKREAFCPPIQDWIVLELGVESEPIYMSNRISDFSLRVNFDKVCHAVVFQFFVITGSGPVLPYHVDIIDPNIDVNCGNVNPPEGVGAVCPAYVQCYKYGTYFMKMRNFEPNSLISVKVSALEIESGPQKTESLPDAPAVVIPDVNYPFHVPLRWSVPNVIDFAPEQSAVPFVLTSYFCGFVTIQANMEQFNASVLPSEGSLVFVSLDVNNPFPSSVTNDMLFLALPFAKIYMCSEDLQQPAHLFLLLVRSSGAGLGLPGRITVTVDYDRPELIPITSPQRAGSQERVWSKNVAWPAANWYSFGEGALQLNCPGFSRLSCRAGCEKFGCCQNTWPVYPTGRLLQPLYPVPYPLRFLNQDIIFSDFAYFPEYLDAHSMGITLVLEQNFGGSIQYGPLGPDWPSILPTCTISGGESAMGTLDGRWISGSYTPTLIDTKPCDAQAFAGISDNMNYLFGLFARNQPSNIGTTRPLSLRYRVDILTALDPWIDCRAYVDNNLLVDVPLQLTAEETKECPIYDANDPCCNPDLAWNQCCAPRDVTFNLDFKSNTTEDFEAVCQLPSCTLPILDTYVQGGLNEITGECEPAVLGSPSEATTQSVTAFTTCLATYFGTDYDLQGIIPKGSGKLCFEDGDCPQVNGSRCDVIAHVCLGDTEALSMAFLQCLIDTISVSARLTLIEREGWSQAVKRQSLASLLYERYSANYCTRRFHPIMGTLYRPYFQTFTGFPGCPLGNFRSLTNAATATVWQSARQATGGNCAYDFSSVTPNINAQICNQAEVYTLNGCMACITPDSCISVSSNTCTGSVCVLADGTISTDVGNCPNIMRCTDGTYDSVESCQASGVCEDKDQLYYFLNNTLWAQDHSRAGMCAFPMAPYNAPDCNVLYPGSFPTSYGCIRLGRCVATGLVLDCQVDFDSQVSCQNAGGVWYPYPNSKQLCETPVLCDIPRYTGLRTATWESTIQYASNVTGCEQCGGTIKPINTWIANRWLGGVVVNLTVMTNAVIQPFEYARSLDFLSLSRVNIEATESSTAFQTLNALQCSYGNQKTQVATLACACNSSGYSVRDTCFGQTTTIGRARFCPFTDNKVVSPPFVFSSDNTSLSPRLIYECITFEIGKVASQVFDVPPVVPVTIAFRRRVKLDFTPGSYAVVYNSQGALVGSVVGDGVELQFDRLASNLLNMYICQTLPPSITPDPKYSVYDFGLVDNGNRYVTPLHLNVTFDDGVVCALFDFSTVDSVVTFAPIARLPRDETVSGPNLTDGEKACLYIVASLFALASAVWLGLAGRIFHASKFDWRTPSNVVWICVLWIFVQRCVYLYLVAAGVLNRREGDELLDYFLMDFPMCVYLIAMYQIGLSFFMLCTRPDGAARTFWLSFIVGAFLIVMLFIGTLIAFQVNVLDQSGVTGPLLCPIYHDASNTARIIRLIYQSIILFVALCIGGGELIFGLRLHDKVSEISGPKILILCVTASCGIMSDSIAFLIYYIVDDPSPYFSIVLIFTEIVPLIGILIRLMLSAASKNNTTGSLSSPSGAIVSNSARPTYSIS